VTRDSHDGARGPTDAAPTLADDALLTPFREADEPVLTTGEVRESVPFGGGPTAEGLDRLAAEGVLERKSVGDEAVWWLPGYTATDERRGPMPGATHEYEGGLSSQLENEISTLDAPDERERAAVYAACYYLSEYGPASPETLRAEVFPQNAGGYDDPDRWWRECVRPALAALSGVERDGEKWRIS
jgi:hypothetical protein